MSTATLQSTGGGPHWFSTNPSKAWGEKFFLIYSPIWMTGMGVVMASGLTKTIGDVGFMIIALSVALPLVVIPALIRDETALGRRWYQTYWFKANVYIAVFSFVANYFGSEYFFDILGMVYNYPSVHLNLDAALVGSGEQRVPVVMYLLTQAYFLTYHSSANVVLRRIRTSSLPFVRLLFPLLLVVVAYFWAWMETKSMANPLIADQFYYKDMGRMLAYGSLVYGFYFFASFPIFHFLDEARDSRWTLRITIAAACTASVGMLLLLDFWAHLVGPI